MQTDKIGYRAVTPTRQCPYDRRFRESSGSADCAGTGPESLGDVYHADKQMFAANTSGYRLFILKIY